MGGTRDHVVRLPPDVTAPLLAGVPAAAGADVTEVLVAGAAAWPWPAGGPRAAATRPRRWSSTWSGTAASRSTPDVDLTRTVGWFTAIAPVRLPGVGDGDDDPGAVLRGAADALRAAPDGGLGFGLLRYLNPRTAAALARLGAPQVLFNYLGRYADGTADWDTAPEADALRVAPDADLGTPYLLEINVACHDDARRAAPAGRVHLRRRGPRRRPRQRRSPTNGCAPSPTSP